MEPPIIPLSPRNRLRRDYTSEEHVPRVTSVTSGRTARREMDTSTSPRIPTSPRVPTSPASTSRHNSIDTRTNGYRPAPSIRVKSPEMFEEPSMDTIDQGYTGPMSQQDPMQDMPDELRKLDFNLDVLEEKSSYAPSVSSLSQISQHTGITGSSGSKLTDFFSNEIFQIVLHNPTTAHQLLKFSQSRLCGENMEFLEKVDRYHTLLNDVAKTMFEIHRDFISVNAPSQINIDHTLLLKANKDLKTSLAQTLPKLESVFVDSQSDIERLVSLDIYPRFVRHQMTMSASKALAADKGKYAGLGDCFVLTDPAKADNPIVYASDGFVKVTGYERSDIIPRNCRFLQNSHTDRAAVKRLRVAIDKREESVELLLNQKKNGEPFWNLLYTAPLFDARGNTVFFIGGQINCSTTVHNASDILRILAMSSDVDDSTDTTERESRSMSPVAAPKAPTRGSRLFSAFRSNSANRVASVPTRAAGMEDGLLSKIEKLNLKKQMDVFYTAYSKYLVVNATTNFIGFHSAGVVELLYPSNPLPIPRPTPFSFNSFNGNNNNLTALPNVASPAGMDVFKFLASHCPKGTLPVGFKDRVKASVRAGQPVSLDLNLCTRRYMGFQKFVVHWTPLKDEGSATQWVVVTMGGAME